MHDKTRNDLEDLALGEGADYYLTNGYLNPSEIPEEEAPDVRAAAEVAVQALATYETAAKTLQAITERWLAANPAGGN